MGRMWHSLFPGQWKDVFFWLPIEELIQSRQKEYYDALGQAFLFLLVGFDRRLGIVVLNDSFRVGIPGVIDTTMLPPIFSNSLQGVVYDDTLKNKALFAVRYGYHEIEGEDWTPFARSSVAYQATQIGLICGALAEMAGYDFDSDGHVPGWAVNPNSKLTPIACEAYEALTGEKMIVEPVHAGVECGAFAEKNSELDMIAIGPTLIDVHTPGETCDLKAVEITTELLIEIVERLTA